MLRISSNKGMRLAREALDIPINDLILSIEMVAEKTSVFDGNIYFQTVIDNFQPRQELLNDKTLLRYYPLFMPGSSHFFFHVWEKYSIYS